MEVRLTSDQEALVRQAIESGRLHRAEDAVEEALLLWEERERKRAEFLATLDDAKVSLARGEGRNITQQAHDSALRASRLRKCIRPCSVQYPIALQSIMYIAHKFTLENRLSLDSLISMVVTVLRCAN
jgi:Arc/MetJ-type ribon-helix-helix transcriptional regulator